MPRVLRMYHSAVVDEYRNRELALTRTYGWDVHLVCPPVWNEGGADVVARPSSSTPVHIVPTLGPRHPILFWYRYRDIRRLVDYLRPDVVDIHEEPYSLSAAAAIAAVDAVDPDTPVCLYTAQNIDKRYPPPFRQLERRALNRAA